MAFTFVAKVFGKLDATERDAGRVDGRPRALSGAQAGRHNEVAGMVSAWQRSGAKAFGGSVTDNAPQRTSPHRLNTIFNQQ